MLVSFALFSFVSVQFCLFLHSGITYQNVDEYYIFCLLYQRKQLCCCHGHSLMAAGQNVTFVLHLKQSTKESCLTGSPECEHELALRSYVTLTTLRVYYLFALPRSPLFVQSV